MHSVWPQIGITQNVYGEHKGGYIFPVQLKVSRVDSSNGVTFVGVLHPLIENKTGIISINKQGSIHSINRAALTMFGYTPGDLLGKNVKILCPPDVAFKHDGYVASAKRYVIDEAVFRMGPDSFITPLSLCVYFIVPSMTKRVTKFFGPEIYTDCTNSA